MTIMTFNPLSYQSLKCLLVPGLSQVLNTWKLMMVVNDDDVKTYYNVLLDPYPLQALEI